MQRYETIANDRNASCQIGYGDFLVYKIEFPANGKLQTS